MPSSTFSERSRSDASFPADRPAADTAEDDYSAVAGLGERVITGVAVTLAILFVSTVAVLMGMA